MLSLSASNHEFYQGVDAKIKSHLPQNSNYLLPSHRFTERLMVENVRFFGGQKTWDPEYRTHTQSLQSYIDAYTCAQDHVESVIRCLYPSPNGVFLVANQAVSDPLSSLKADDMGHMLKAIIDFKHSPKTEKDQQDFEKKVFNLLLPGAHWEKKSNDHIRKFNEFDFKFHFAQHLKGQIDCKSLDIDLNDPHWFSKLAKVFINTLHIPIFQKFPTDYKEFDVYLGAKERHKELKSLEDKLKDKRILENKTRKTLERVSKTLKELTKDIESGKVTSKNKKNHKSTLANQATKLEKKLKKYQQIIQELETGKSNVESGNQDVLESLHFLKKSKEYKSLSFAQSLMQALKNDHKDTMYPPQIIERSVAAFFWYRASSNQDIIDFYQALLPNDCSLTPSDLQNTYTSEDYDSLKSRLLNKREESRETYSEADEICSLLSQGYQIYESKWPKLLNYRSAYFNPKTKTSLAGASFSDCVETALRNVFNVLFYVNGEEGFDTSSLKEDSFLQSFYKEFDTIQKQFTQKAHDRWGTAVAEIPKVNYCKPKDVKEKQYQKERKTRLYELNTGVVNFIRVIDHLMGTQDESISRQLSMEKPDLRILEEALSKILSQEGKTVKCSLEQDGKWDNDLKDSFVDIAFTINNKKIITLYNSAIHSQVNYSDRNTSDWREDIDPDLITPAFRPYIFGKKKIESLLNGLSPEKALDILWKMDLDSAESKTNVIRYIYQNSLYELEGFSHRLISKIASLNDGHTDNALLDIIMESIDRESNWTLNDDQLFGILSNCIHFFYKAIDSDIYNNKTILHWALDTNKEDLVNLAFKKLHRIDFIGSDEKILDVLDKFKAIRWIHMQTGLSSDDQNRFVQKVRSLDSLLRLGGLKVDNKTVGFLKELIDVLPKHLYVLNVSAKSPFGFSKAKELIDTFLGKFTKIGTLDIIFDHTDNDLRIKLLNAYPDAIAKRRLVL